MTYLPIAWLVDKARHARSSLWLDALGLIVLIWLIYIEGGSFSHLPYIDELYHVLAARSWNAEGTLRIGDGEYRRAALYTITLAQAFSAFGESLFVGRVFSTVVAGLWLLAFFFWLRLHAGRPVAWIAVVLFSVMPESMILFHFIRFYAWHGLFFFLGAIGCYSLMHYRGPPVRTAAIAAASALALGVAFRLHLVSVIGLLALFAWALVELGPRAIDRIRAEQRLQWVAGMVALLLLIAVALAVEFGVVSRLIADYRWSSHHNDPQRNNFLFYHSRYLDLFPVLWGLFPLAGVLAIRWRPRLGVFCTCVFAVAFILQSFGAMKAERYLHYMMPFFFTLWAIVIVETVPWVRRWVAEATARVLDGVWLRPLRPAAEWACVLAIAGFLVGTTPALKMTFDIMRDWPASKSSPRIAWRDARDFLQPWVDRASVIMTTVGVATFYYFGDYDYQFGKGVPETDSGSEFGIDQRTGRPVISSAESLQFVLSCYPSGLFITEPTLWRNPKFGVSDEAADLLESYAEEIPVPEEWAMRVFAWNRPGTVPPQACADLPRWPGRGQ